MRIAIFGTGGVGGYFGGRLAQAGHDVTFLARGAHLRAIRDAGLRVTSTLGDFTVQPAQATDDPAEVGEVELVLVAVKAWQVADAAAAMRPMVGAETVVLPLQNGVEAPAQLAGVLGAGPVLGGLCRILSYVEGPGHIHHAGIEPYIALGEMDGARSERMARLVALLQAAEGIQAEAPADIRSALWAKFLLICPWSGVGAVTRAPIGVTRSLPGTRALLEGAMAEVAAVARGHGIALPEGIIARTLAFLDGLPEGGTASMQRDIAEGRPSELEAQNGAVVRLGAEVGVPTPVNSFLYHALLPQELQARGALPFAG